MEPAVSYYPHFLEGLKNPVDAAHYVIECMEVADKEKDYALFFRALRDIHAAGRTLSEVFANIPREEFPNFEERLNCMAVKLERFLTENPSFA